MDLNILEKNIGYTFKDDSLLKRALTHSSYAGEKCKNNPHLKCNERLEFVGDAVVGLIVASYLFNEYPDLPEGKMSRLRSSVVCEESLAILAKKLGVPSFIKLGVGEFQTGGKDKPSILSDCMESIVAAIFMDSDFDTVKNIMLPFFIDLFKDAGKEMIQQDYKSKLQEVLALTGHIASYEIVGETGPDHDKCFIARVCQVGTGNSATGEGKTKRSAEQVAAGNLLKKINGGKND